MFGNKGYTVSDLAPLAIAFVVITITVGMGALILAETETATYDDITTTNETFNATSDPYTHTVTKASNADFVELTSATCYSDAGSTELSDSACNISDASAGDITLSTTVDSGDEAVDYNHDSENQATSVLQDGLNAVQDFSGWFSILVIVVIAAVMLGIVMRYFSGMGSGASKRV